jgi:hypothetical protein
MRRKCLGDGRFRVFHIGDAARIRVASTTMTPNHPSGDSVPVLVKEGVSVSTRR